MARPDLQMCSSELKVLKNTLVLYSVSHGHVIQFNVPKICLSCNEVQMFYMLTGKNYCSRTTVQVDLKLIN